MSLELPPRVAHLANVLILDDARIWWNERKRDARNEITRRLPIIRHVEARTITVVHFASNISANLNGGEQIRIRQVNGRRVKNALCLEPNRRWVDGSPI